MQSTTLNPDEYLKALRKKGAVLLDARSEKEFEKAHIPGAISFPLLNNEDRHEIGIIYKQKGRRDAVLKGFERVGPRFHELLLKAQNIIGDNEVFLYCWRGGMRSNILAWLLQVSGFKVTLLKGGYKAFRNRMLEEFQLPRSITILGGKTGSGKTELLHLLRAKGEHVIDLEGLASHKGSAFGLLGMPPQPSQEQFENELGYELYMIGSDVQLWIENESRLIGKIVIPNALYNTMREAPVVEIEVPRTQREERIYREYCVFPNESLAEHTLRIGKRLGPQNVKSALEFLESNDQAAWLKIVLDYYDKTYGFSQDQRDPAKTRKVLFSWENTESDLPEVIKAKYQ